MIPIWGKAGGGSGGGGGIALVDHTKLTPVANNGGTTAGITTTGSNLICVTVASYSVVSPPTLSDNKSNSYTQAILKNDAIDNGRVAIFYSLSPAVGSGHTFTLTGIATYCTMCIEAFSGVDTGFGIDQVSTPGSSSSSPVSAGSIIPGANGSLVYTGAEVSGDVIGGRIFSINSGMTISDQVSFSSGVYFGSMGAYLIQGAAAAINPSVSYPGTVGGMAAGSISFRAA